MGKWELNIGAGNNWTPLHPLLRHSWFYNCIETPIFQYRMGQINENENQTFWYRFPFSGSYFKALPPPRLPSLVVIHHYHLILFLLLASPCSAWNVLFWGPAQPRLWRRLGWVCILRLRKRRFPSRDTSLTWRSSASSSSAPRFGRSACTAPTSRWSPRTSRWKR